MMASVLALGLRGLGLIARFALLLYLAKYLSLAEVGAFGLVSGAVSMAPVLFGWGINYFLGREVVDRSLRDAGPLIRDRLLVSIASLMLATALAAAIVLLDGLALDIYVALIGLRKIVFANAMLFLRSSAWAFPTIALGLLFPTLRTFEFVLWMWLGGLLLTCLALCWELRRWPVAVIVDEPVNLGRIRRWFSEAPLVYINDVAIASVLYLDRYVVSHYLGLEQTGLFTLYWAIANGLHVLMHSGFLQIAAVRLVSAATLERRVEWRNTMRLEAAKLAAGSVALSVVLFGAVAWLLPALGIAKGHANLPLFAIMLAANTVRLESDLLHYGIYSWKLDRPLALVNLGCLLVTLLFSIVGTATFQLFGAGFAMLASAVVVLGWRAEIVRRHWARIG